MEQNKQKLRRSGVIDYLTQIMPELELSTISGENVYASEDGKSKVALIVPSIDGGGQPNQANAPKPSIAPVPSNEIKQQPNAPVQPAQPKSPGIPQPNQAAPMVNKSDVEVKALGDKVNELYKLFDGYVSFTDLNNFKNVLIEEISDKISSLNSKFDEFQKHITPDRTKYDSEVIYKNRVYEKVVSILDEILINMLDGLVPDYTLISIQNTKYFDDGSICNSLVDLSMKIYYQNVTVNFTVQVPIVNGIIFSPLYIQKQNKIVPLMKEEIYKELLAASGVALDSISPNLNINKNIFSPVSDTFRVRQDPNQKEYLVNTPLSRAEKPIDQGKNFTNVNNFKSRSTSADDYTR